MRPQKNIVTTLDFSSWMPSTFQSLKSMLWDGFETLPINGASGAVGAKCCGGYGMRCGEIGRCWHFRPGCKPFRAELSDVAGMVNLRCAGCALRRAICHFGRPCASANIARRQSVLAVRWTFGGSRWPGYALVELPSGGGRNGGVGWLGEPDGKGYWGFAERTASKHSGRPWRLISRPIRERIGPA